MNTVDWTVWTTRAKQGFLALAFLALGLLAGMYILAPRQAKSDLGYVPRAAAELPAGTVRLTNLDGSATLLPVKLLETGEARRLGLREIGPRALETSFFLYAHPRELGNRTTYNMEGIRAPLELAVINSEGVIVAIKRVAPGEKAVVVTERHRWVLAVKEGMLAHYNITAETALDPAGIRKKA